MFLVGELGISAVGEYGRRGEVSQVTHPNINALVVYGLVRGGGIRTSDSGNDSVVGYNSLYY